MTLHSRSTYGVNHDPEADTTPVSRERLLKLAADIERVEGEARLAAERIGTARAEVERVVRLLTLSCKLVVFPEPLTIANQWAFEDNAEHIEAILHGALSLLTATANSLREYGGQEPPSVLPGTQGA